MVNFSGQCPLITEKLSATESTVATVIVRILLEMVGADAATMSVPSLSMFSHWDDLRAARFGRHNISELLEFDKLCNRVSGRSACLS